MAGGTKGSSSSENRFSGSADPCPSQHCRRAARSRSTTTTLWQTCYCTGGIIFRPDVYSNQSPGYRPSGLCLPAPTLQQISLFSTMIAMSPVLPMILRIRQTTIGQISAPNDGYKIPDPTAGTSVLLITLTNIRTQLAVDSTTVTVGRWLQGGGN
ncbi:hypothetical protein MKX08_007933 [Trichoderma sp. CBMAI-0020]|nr:hypothetical protein MKX08_007933 [Trichoderma sp. CBMAI-0020]